MGYTHNTNYCEYLFVNLIDIGHPLPIVKMAHSLALPHMLPTHFPTFQECSPHVFLPSKSVPHMFSYLPRVIPTHFPTFQGCSPHVFLPSKSVPHTFSCLPRVFPKFIVNEWRRVGRIRCSSSLVRKRSL
jgi:hypothetical protein